MQLESTDPSPLVSSFSSNKTISRTDSDNSLVSRSFYSCYSDGTWRRTFHLGSRGMKWCLSTLGVAAALIAMVFFYNYPLWHWIYETIGVRRDSIIQYGTIPLVAALVGWGTNAIAISMTFYPLEFVGCCPSVQLYGMPIFGWQGIVPANCKRMAEGAVENLTTQMFNPSEAANRVDTNRIVMELRPALERLTVKIVDTIALEYASSTWKRLPDSVKSEIKQKCLDKSSGAISQMSSESHRDLTGIFNVQKLLVDLLVRDKPLVNDIFLKMFDKEYEFIRVSGGYLGFLFGLIQMALFSNFNQWWSLPIAGFLVGYLTNWVALKCLFNPVDAWYMCGFRIQGLFLLRQGEVAAIYGDMFASKVLNAENLLLGMIKSETSDGLFDILNDSVRQGIDAAAKKVVLSRRVAGRLIGQGKYAAIKARVCELIREDISSFVPYVTPYLDEVLDVRATLETAMGHLTSQEFADMMLPAFREGEFKLIVIGGVLGAAVGVLQALWQVPDQLGL